MSEPVLRPRLQGLFLRARSLLKEAAGFHDIACDHAKLAAAVAAEFPELRIEASDILESAVARARMSTTLSEASLFVSDGFTAHTLTDGDLVVIAGVGGHTILELLTEAADWKGAREPLLRLLLQTSQQVEVLREYLYTQQGILVQDEFLVRDRGRLYVNFEVELRLPLPPPSPARPGDYRYYGGGPRLFVRRDSSCGLLRDYLRQCSDFAEMKIESLNSAEERMFWRRSLDRVRKLGEEIK